MLVVIDCGSLFMVVLFVVLCLLYDDCYVLCVGC